MDGLDEYSQQKGICELILEISTMLISDQPEKPIRYLADWLHKQLTDEASLQDSQLHLKSNMWKVQAITDKMHRHMDFKNVISCTLAGVKEALNCDRVSVFYYSSGTNRLILHSSNMVGSSDQISIDKDHGIAGHVFTHKKTVNIRDCYSDDRFDFSMDRRSGYLTRCMLVTPIPNEPLEPIGVIQAINRKTGAFSEVDEWTLNCIAQSVSVALRNVHMLEEVNQLNVRSYGLLDISSAFLETNTTHAIIHQLTKTAMKLTKAERCNVWFKGKGKDDFWTLSDENKEIKILNSPFLTWVTENEGIIINDPEGDQRYTDEADRKFQFTPRVLIAIPIRSLTDKAETPTTHGVLQVMNKSSIWDKKDNFHEPDLTALQLLNDLIGRTISQNSKRLQGGNTQKQKKDRSEVAAPIPREKKKITPSLE